MKKNKKEMSLATLTPEEIENNHIVKSTRSYFIVFGIFFLTVILLFVASMFSSNITPDYPLVFRDANNKLMVVTKSSNGKKDITTISDANIVYAHEDIRYILYSHNNKLYLLDTTSAGEGKILSENVKLYGFSSDDKTIYYINKNNDLHIYERKSESDYLIDSNTKDCVDIVGNYVLYNKNDNLVNKNYLTAEVEVVSKNFDNVIIGKDGKQILYSILNEDETSNYYVFTFSNSDNKKVLNNVANLLSYNNLFTKFMYTIKSKDVYNIYSNISDSVHTQDKAFKEITKEMVEKNLATEEEYEANRKLKNLVEERNKMRDYTKDYLINGYDIYYQNKDTKTLMASGVNDVYYDNLDNKRVVYTKNTWDNDFDIANYENFETFKLDINSKAKNGLYFSTLNNYEPSLISNNVASDINVYYQENDGIYYTENKKLYYSQVSNKKANSAVVIDENLELDTLFENYEDGMVYITNEANNSSLKYVNGGKFKIINENVNSKFIKVSESNIFIYYLKDYENNKGSLMLFNGIRNSKIADNVSSFVYINDDLIYLTTNYDASTKTYDLYRLNGSKLTLIHEDILEWFSPIVEKTVAPEK